MNRQRIISAGGKGRNGYAMGGGSFLSLSDVPHSYAGTANYVLTVNGTANGITFVLGKGVAGGFASLDGTGKVPSSELPSIAITDFLGTAADQPAMLLLTGEKGDWCIRSDLSTTWVIVSGNGSIIGDWQEISYPAQPYKIMVTGTDLFPDYLYNKLIAGKGISLTLLGVGDQDVQISNISTWREPVISIFDNTTALPVAPVLGDRYIAGKTAHGWTTSYIYEWNGAAWIETIPVDGDCISEIDSHLIRQYWFGYDGNFWQPFVSTLDVRLNDARTPTAHASTHNAGGSDALAIDAVAATGSFRTLGTSATSACAGNDSRLSNARTPTAHASTHNAGGADAMAIDAAAATGSLRTLGTGATAAAAGNHGHTVPFEKGNGLYNPSGITTTPNLFTWVAPYACTVTAIKGYRVGGTGATINARRNAGAVSNHLASALSLTSADTVMDGGAVQDTTYAAGDKLEIMIVSVAGSPTQVSVQVNFTKTV